MKKKVFLNNRAVTIDVLNNNANFILFNFEGQEYSINLESTRSGKFILGHNGGNVNVVNSGPSYIVNGKEVTVSPPTTSRNKAKDHTESSMSSPMPGKILKIMKSVGDQVVKGDAILVMEAMKMEHTIKATSDGKIEKIFYKEGDQVPAKVELVKLC